MFFYQSDEERDRAVALHVRRLRDAAALFPRLRPVLERFDGKVYNKRFDDAVRAAFSELPDGCRVWCSRGYNGWINVAFHARGILSGRDVYLLCFRVADDKRLHAAELIAGARKSREELLRQAAEIERQAAGIELTLQRIRETEALLSRLKSGVNYALRDVYGIR